MKFVVKPTVATFAVILQPSGDDWRVYQPFTKEQAEAMVKRAMNTDSVEDAYAVEIETVTRIEEVVSGFERDLAAYEERHGLR